MNPAAAALALLSLACLAGCSPSAPKQNQPSSSVPKEMIDKAEAAKEKANQAVARRDSEALPTETAY